MEQPASKPRRLPEAGDLRILAVLNPGSSNFPKARLKFEYLQDLGFCAAEDTIFTAASRHETANTIADKLTAGREIYDAVIVESGDGGANTVAQGLHSSNDDRLQTMPVIFGKGGGACDLHAMTQAGTADYLANLPGQAIRAIYPIELQASTLDGRFSRSEAAFAHLAIGGLGRIAYAVNGQAHRRSKFLGKPYLHELQEFITAGKSLNPVDRFYIREDGQAKRRLISDIIMTNGNQMGRRRLFPDNIFEPGYHQVVAPNIAAVFAIAGLLFAGNTSSMEPRMQSDFYITRRRAGKQSLVSYDGETFQVPLPQNNGHAGQLVTHLHVAVADRPLRVATAHEASE